MITSLNTLSTSEWNQVSSRWSRGINWCVGKEGRKWKILSSLPQFAGLYKTKTAAYEAMTTLVLAEARARIEVPGSNIVCRAFPELWI